MWKNIIHNYVLGFKPAISQHESPPSTIWTTAPAQKLGRLVLKWFFWIIIFADFVGRILSRPGLWLNQRGAQHVHGLQRVLRPQPRPPTKPSRPWLHFRPGTNAKKLFLPQLMGPIPLNFTQLVQTSRWLLQIRCGLDRCRSLQKIKKNLTGNRLAAGSSRITA